MATFLVLGRPPSGRPLLDGLLVTRAAPEPAHPELTDAMAADEASDALAFLVHSGRPFEAAAADARGVVRILAATVAALRGDDVRTAWCDPVVETLVRVPDPAARALREVLTHVWVSDVDRVRAALASLGLGSPEPVNDPS